MPPHLPGVHPVLQAVPNAQPICFGSREQLVADLATAVEPDAAPKVLVLFALDGFRDLVRDLGRLESERLSAELSLRLAEAAGPTGVWYRPRDDEFAVLCDAPSAALEPLLRRATAALCESGLDVSMIPVCGSVSLPAEASDPKAALRLADERVASARPRPHSRERREERRAADPVRAAAGEPGDAASVEPLHAIHGELVEAAAATLKARQMDQLLNVATTLSGLADAARLDGVPGEVGRLREVRDPGRIPLLLRELALKLAALSAVGGPEIAEAAELLREPKPISPVTARRALEALDAVSAALVRAAATDVRTREAI
jgi:GGDEF domain-containing protein